jgi:lipopolysaccharide/colanic/teichoic acid biosynthesis glycosyltransferase
MNDEFVRRIADSFPDLERNTRVHPIPVESFAQETWMLLNGMVRIDGGAAKRLYRCCKRAIDAVVSFVLFVLLSPMMLIVAILIMIDSPGPILFVQQRMGCRPHYNDGRVVFALRSFRCYKFRSMRANVEDTLHQTCVRDFVNGRKEMLASRGTFKLRGDQRVTRVGRWLRKASIDELPQLINVLKGEMSLVGPRPVPLYEVAHYQQTHLARLGALPGITGLWQVNGRCELSFDEMVRLDREYISQASLWLDLKIILQTIPVVIAGRGAE